MYIGGGIPGTISSLPSYFVFGADRRTGSGDWDDGSMEVSRKLTWTLAGGPLVSQRTDASGATVYINIHRVDVRRSLECYAACRA